MADSRYLLFSEQLSILNGDHTSFKIKIRMPVYLEVPNSIILYRFNNPLKKLTFLYEVSVFHLVVTFLLSVLFILFPNILF